MEHVYAQALWKMIQSGKKSKDAVAALYEALQRRGRVSLWPKIGRAFERIAARDHARNGVVLSVARETDVRAAERDIKTHLSDMGVERADVSVHIDDSLIGGWRLEGREHLVDASFKKYLLALYNRATK